MAHRKTSKRVKPSSKSLLQDLYCLFQLIEMPSNIRANKLGGYSCKPLG